MKRFSISLSIAILLGIQTFAAVSKIPIPEAAAAYATPVASKLTTSAPESAATLQSAIDSIARVDTPVASVPAVA
jgi:hypothetical protein